MNTKSVITSINEAAKKLALTVGIKPVNVSGTPEYEKKIKGQPYVDILNEEWSEGESLWSSVRTKITGYRNFYNGEIQEQWNETPAGDLQLVVNLGATIIDLFTYILSNNTPSVQIVSNTTDQVAQTRSDFIEDMVRRLLDDAKFPVRFRDSVKSQFQLGFVWLYPFWNTDRKDGGEKGTYDLTVLNSFTTRVKYAGNDYEKIVSFITEKRMLPSEIKRLYEFEAIPDSESNMIPSGYSLADDGMAGVFTRYDDKKWFIVCNGQTISGPFEHNFKKCPIYQIDNIKSLNDPVGNPESKRWQGICQEINALLTSISEISRDLGYPGLLEYNNALGGKHLPKIRGNKIPVRRTDQGEALTYLINPAQIQPIIKQAQFMIELLHFASLMPQAATGAFGSNVTSGFQAQLAMQPATLTTNNRKLDWENAIKLMVQDAFRLLAKESPESVTFESGTKDKIVIDDIALHEIKVVWGDALPIDVSREVQNLVMGLTNRLTSLHQAIDRYNALLGLGTTSDTMDYQKEEAKDVTLDPKNAALIAESAMKIQQIADQIQQTQGKVDQLREMMNNGGGGNIDPNAPPATETATPTDTTAVPPTTQPLNPTNLARSATSLFPEQKKNYPTTGREAVSTNSTGGRVIPPIKVKKKK